MALQGNHQQSLELSIHSSWQISPAWRSGLFMTLLVIAWCLTQLACYFCSVKSTEILMTGTALCLSTPACGKGERYINKETPVGSADRASFLVAYFLHLAVFAKNILSGNNWCNSINSIKWTFNFFVVHQIASFLERSHYTDTTHKAVAWSKFPAITLKSFLSVRSDFQSLENSVGLTFSISLKSQHFPSFLLPSPEPEPLYPSPR